MGAKRKAKSDALANQSAVIRIEEELNNRLLGIAAVEQVTRLDDQSFHVLLTYAEPDVESLPPGKYDGQITDVQQNGDMLRVGFALGTPSTPIANSVQSALPIERTASEMQRLSSMLHKIRSDIQATREKFLATDPLDPMHSQIGSNLAGLMTEYSYQSSQLAALSNV